MIRKAKASQAKKAVTPLTQDPGLGSHESDLDRTGELAVVPQQRFDALFTIRPTLEERATCHFVSQYFVGIQAPSRDILDNLSLLYKSNAVDENLFTAIRAVSFASYGHLTHSSELADASRYQYTKAISFTNAALRSDVHATKDSTLMSIMILGMYEILTGCNQRSLEAWIEHIRGSSALLKLRGHDQLKTPAGRRLFTQATTGILTGCVQLNVPVPKHIMEMVKKMPELMDIKDDFVDIAFAIHLAMLDVNQFRAAVEKGTISDPHTILGKALVLDQRLSSVYENTPLEFQFHVLRAAPASDVAFQGYYHVYFDLLTANLWNALRVFRTLLHQKIRETLLQGFSSRPPVFTMPEHTAQFQASTDICFKLQVDILCSVPQHLGYVKSTGKWEAPQTQKDGTAIGNDRMASGDTPPLFRSAYPLPHGDGALQLGHSTIPKDSLSEHIVTNDGPASKYGLSDVPTVRASGGYNLLWPLWFAGAMDLATEEIRAYSMKSLKRIGNDMGIRQALMLAKIIENKGEVEAWNDKTKFEVVEDG